jgi:hypothetical protein
VISICITRGRLDREITKERLDREFTKVHEKRERGSRPPARIPFRAFAFRAFSRLFASFAIQTFRAFEFFRALRDPDLSRFRVLSRPSRSKPLAIPPSLPKPPPGCTIQAASKAGGDPRRLLTWVMGNPLLSNP